MSMDDPEYFSCPYCGSENSLPIDPTGGSRQKLIIDCETCCQPIVVKLRLSGTTILELNIYQENE